jgi:hypothetical protein
MSRPGEPKDGPAQYVILYDKRGERGVVYDTAYTEAQLQDAIKRCVRRHGRMGTKVRSRLASEVA